MTILQKRRKKYILKQKFLKYVLHLPYDFCIHIVAFMLFTEFDNKLQQFTYYSKYAEHKSVRITENRKWVYLIKLC